MSTLDSLIPADPKPNAVTDTGSQTLRERISEALAAELGDALDCTRVWSAWGYGTMKEDDFVPVTERLDDIVDGVLATLDADAGRGEVERLRERAMSWRRVAERCEMEKQAALAQPIAPAVPAEVFRCVFAFQEIRDGMHGNVPKSVRDFINATLDAFPAPSILKMADSYYSDGKDADWFGALSDADAAKALTHAAQDLNDTGLGDEVDRFMPHNAMLSGAGERIRRLLAALASPAPSDAAEGA